MIEAATIISGISLIISILSFTFKYWEEKRCRVMALGALLSSGEVAHSRYVVARAALQTRRLTTAAQQEFEESAFQLLWTIQRITPELEILKNTALGHDEALWLYRQLETILPDLHSAIYRHGQDVDWEPTLSHTNEVLSELPIKLHGRWRATIARNGPFETISADSPPQQHILHQRE